MALRDPIFVQFSAGALNFKSKKTERISEQERL